MATAVVDEWTEEKCLQLIREYRARPMLWDPKDPFYFKKIMKPLAWKEISDAINVSAERCKHKMIIMMSSFRREKAKIVHSLKEKDKTRVYRSTWFAFDEMYFLIDKENERKRQMGIDDEEVTEKYHNPRSLLKQHIGGLQSSIKIKRFKSLNDSNETQTIKEKEIVEDRPSFNTWRLPEPEPSTTDRDEEIKSFTSFIGNKMKKYSETTKNAVQQAICEIIFKADQHYYDSTDMNSFTIIDEPLEPLDKMVSETTNSTIVKDEYSDSSN